MEETVKLVKSKGKQMVFHLQVKAKDGQPFLVRARVQTGAQANLIRTGLARDLVKPSKRPLRLVPANGEVLGGGDKEVELMIHFLQRNAEVQPDLKGYGRPRGAFMRRILMMT